MIYIQASDPGEGKNWLYVPEDVHGTTLTLTARFYLPTAEIYPDRSWTLPMIEVSRREWAAAAAAMPVTVGGLASQIDVVARANTPTALFTSLPAAVVQLCSPPPTRWGKCRFPEIF